MTRNDYIMLCHALAEGLHSGKLMDSLCGYLQRDNPKFSRDKFEWFLRTLIERKQQGEK